MRRDGDGKSPFYQELPPKEEHGMAQPMAQHRDWLRGVKAPRAGGAHRDAAIPAKHSKLCFCPKADPAAAPFEKAEPAPGYHSSFCS